MPSLRVSPILLAAALTAFGSNAQAGEQPGAYLAGRVASMTSDYAAAADYFSQALLADPTNLQLLESAILSEIGVGDFEKAKAISEALESTGQKSGLADLAILTMLAKSGNFTEAIAGLDNGRSAGRLIDGLFRAWAKLGAGQMSEASAEFDKVAAEPGLAPFALYHKALALALVGDYEGADKIMAGNGDEAVRATRRSIIAHAQILSQLERDPEALKLIDEYLGQDPTDAVVTQMRQDLKAGVAIPFTAIHAPTDGMAEVFLGVASAISGDAKAKGTNSVDMLMFARAAAYLRPDLTEAVLMVAGTLEVQHQNDLAIEAYDLIGKDSPDYVAAALGRAEAILAAGRTDAAIEALDQLAKSQPERIEVWATLGDILRRNERFTAGIAAYDKAIALIRSPAKEQWILYFSRAICFERTDHWDKAEPDFRKALELSPEQPQTLNYLGYSYLEKQINLDEALSMIQRAATARPDDGAIADSLGWGFYRVGKYADAEKAMEHAIQLMPVDSTVNDHLGDVYWAVGRKREAEFQWKRALSFKPETEEAANRIRRKLEVGLDAVLKEEGAEPLAVSTNGN